MGEIGQYVLTLVCGALISGVVLSIGTPTAAGYSLRKLICGIFLTFLAISPLREIDFGDFTREFREYSQEAEAAAELGRSQAEEAILDIIKQRCESYILDKAAQMELSLQARVEVDIDTGQPVAVELTGEVSPYEKELLSSDIAQELGIEKEAQTWIRHGRKKSGRS